MHPQSITRATRPLEQRVGERLAILSNGCWRWTGYIKPNGYGAIRANGQAAYVHRVVYELAFGPVPVDKVLDHLCRHRWCGNPHHLEVVSQRDNVRRGEHPNAVLHRLNRCKAGHEFTADNTITKCNGARRCRVCAQHWERERAPRRKGVAHRG